jgi:DNA-binding CsgD family transcriptional regulator
VGGIVHEGTGLANVTDDDQLAVASVPIGRDAELRIVDDVLDAAAGASTGLIVEGDPGIGKSTLWRETLARAHVRGIRVLVARASAAESVLAYAALADLLADVDRTVWADLPVPQRRALAAALLEDDGIVGAAAEPRAVGAALLNVLTRLAAESPVLLGIDDVQWLDGSSAAAVAFAARRMPARLTIAVTVRTDAARTAAQWLQLPRPCIVHRVFLPPMAVGDMHGVLVSQLRQPISRSHVLRVSQLSGGNPFYALELARELQRRGTDGQLGLPDSLAELMQARIARVDDRAARALLAVASLGDPTIGNVAAALEVSATELVDVLGGAEELGVLAIAGHRLCFAHPLLAHAVHTSATASQRRSMHRRLAQIVTEPELRARHLALADPAGEPATLHALDAAAAVARGRGAQSAAADLLELAIDRGGATTGRRILLARCLFDSGDMRRARDVLQTAIADAAPGPESVQARQLLAMVRLHDDSFFEASRLLSEALPDCGEDSAAQADVLTMLAFAQLNCGQPHVPLVTAERAVTAAQRGGHDRELGRALSMRSMMQFFGGDPIDDDHPAGIPSEATADDEPVAFRAGVQNALLQGWLGDYAGARDRLARVAERCDSLGQEGEFMFLAFQMTLFDLWRGELALATVTADDAMRRAMDLGGEAALFIASALQAAVAAHRGHIPDARRHVDTALTAGAESGYVLMRIFTLAIDGFIELSLGNHAATLTRLEQALAMAESTPRCTELITSGFLPDAIEALIHLGRHDEADSLVGRLETNGERLGRRWMQAVGARSRALLTAARGDLDAALVHAHAAVEHLEHLDMPFERARTLLTLGRLQRRVRRWRAAESALLQAVELFDRVGTPLWTAHARSELERGTPGRARSTGLTPTERRVARLAADGMRTKDIAAALFVTPKTVDTNLSRIYAKLGIHSRVELVRVLGAADDGGTDPPKV